MAAVVPVQLIGADEVHFSAHFNAVALVSKIMGECRHGGAELACVVVHPDAVRQSTGVHGRAGRAAHGKIAVAVREDDAFFGKSGHVRCFHRPVSAERQRRAGHLVGLDEQEIRLVGGHFALRYDLRSIFPRRRAKRRQG